MPPAINYHGIIDMFFKTNPSTPETEQWNDGKWKISNGLKNI